MGIMKYEPISRSHPGFVSVLHIGNNTEEHYFYYIMEVADDVTHGQQFDPLRYEARTLATDKERFQRLPVDECLRLGLQLASALGHLHRQNLVHRDIKPSNIIFVNDSPKFADIGLVTDIGESATFVGSEGYVPREGPGKPAADIYGLGKVLFELISGQHQLNYPKLPPEFDRLEDATARRAFLQTIAPACEENALQRCSTAKELIQKLQALENATEVVASHPAPAPASASRIVLLTAGTSGPAAALAHHLTQHLENSSCIVFADKSATVTVESAREMENRIREADAAVPLLTVDSIASELMSYEIGLAQDHARSAHGKPRLIPLIYDLPVPLPIESAELVQDAARLLPVNEHTDPAQLARDLLAAIHSQGDLPGTISHPKLEPTGGAVPLNSQFYLTRPGDAAFHEAVASGESFILVKGARQMGKTSLLARGLQRARENGHKVLLTDYQKLNSASFESIEKLYFALGTSLADQLDLDVLPEDTWDSRRSANYNLDRYVKREVLERLTSNLVWGMDEIDRVFSCQFGNDVFGLFRSWHNARALEPSSPWARLTLALAYATEVHTFITDVAQSPFNIGTRIVLRDFTQDQVAELNQKYGSPLRTPADIQSFISLVGGQPYLVRRSLHELASNPQSIQEFQAGADHEEGIFNDHLRRLLVLLARDPILVDAVRAMTRGEPCSKPETFHRLRAAGIITGSTAHDARLRCQLYQTYLSRNL